MRRLSPASAAIALRVRPAANPRSTACSGSDSTGGGATPAPAPGPDPAYGRSRTNAANRDGVTTKNPPESAHARTGSKVSSVTSFQIRCAWTNPAAPSEAPGSPSSSPNSTTTSPGQRSHRDPPDRGRRDDRVGPPPRDDLGDAPRP